MSYLFVDTINKMFSPQSLLDFESDKPLTQTHPCEGCLLGKQHKAAYSVNSLKFGSLVPGSFLHGDASKKISIPS